jgi:hypothetical protein
MLNLTHEPVVTEYLRDLAAARDQARSAPRSAATAAATY